MKLNADTLSTIFICIALVFFVVYMITDWGLVAFISGVCLFTGVMIKFLKEKIEKRKLKKSQTKKS